LRRRKTKKQSGFIGIINVTICIIFTQIRAIMLQPIFRNANRNACRLSTYFFKNNIYSVVKTSNPRRRTLKIRLTKTLPEFGRFFSKYMTIYFLDRWISNHSRRACSTSWCWLDFILLLDVSSFWKTLFIWSFDFHMVDRGVGRRIIYRIGRNPINYLL